MDSYDPAFEWKVVRGIPPKEKGNRGVFPTDKVVYLKVPEVPEGCQD